MVLIDLASKCCFILSHECVGYKNSVATVSAILKNSIRLKFQDEFKLCAVLNLPTNSLNSVPSTSNFEKENKCLPSSIKIYLNSCIIHKANGVFEVIEMCAVSFSIRLLALDRKSERSFCVFAFSEFQRINFLFFPSFKG